MRALLSWFNIWFNIMMFIQPLNDSMVRLSYLLNKLSSTSFVNHAQANLRSKWRKIHYRQSIVKYMQYNRWIRCDQWISKYYKVDLPDQHSVSNHFWKNRNLISKVPDFDLYCMGLQSSHFVVLFHSSFSSMIWQSHV